VVLVRDAVGLAAFTTTRVLVGADASPLIFGVIVLAVVTGTGGGAIADIFLRRPPLVLHEDFHASCVVLGRFALRIGSRNGLPRGHSAFVYIGVVLGTRLIAIRRGGGSAGRGPYDKFS